MKPEKNMADRFRDMDQDFEVTIQTAPTDQPEQTLPQPPILGNPHQCARAFIEALERLKPNRRRAALAYLIGASGIDQPDRAWILSEALRASGGAR